MAAVPTEELLILISDISGAVALVGVAYLGLSALANSFHLIREALGFGKAQTIHEWAADAQEARSTSSSVDRLADAREHAMQMAALGEGQSEAWADARLQEECEAESARYEAGEDSAARQAMKDEEWAQMQQFEENRRG